MNHKSARAPLAAVSIIRLAGCLAGFSTAIGCAADSATDEDPSRGAASPEGVHIESSDDLSLLARVDTGSGAVEFYEADPGHVVVFESGRVGQRPMLHDEARGMQLTEQYEYLSGDLAPQALVDAEARALALADATPNAEELAQAVELDIEERSTPFEAEAAADRDGVAVNAQALTEAQFRAEFCPINSTVDNQAIWTNVTGTGSFTWTRLAWLEQTVMSLRGTVRARARWRPRASWSGWNNVNVPAGHWVRWYENYRPLLGFGWNGMVDSAEGDHYHFCSRAEKN